MQPLTFYIIAATCVCTALYAGASLLLLAIYPAMSAERALLSIIISLAIGGLCAFALTVEVVTVAGMKGIIKNMDAKIRASAIRVGVIGKKFLNLFGLALGPQPRFRELAPIGRAANRADRWIARQVWRYRRNAKAFGPPVLKGKRLARTISNCTGVPLSQVVRDIETFTKE